MRAASLGAVRLCMTLVVLTCLSFPAPSIAQTACPVGVPLGSPTCGPAPVVAGPATPPPPPRPTGEWESRFGAVATDPVAGHVGVAEGRASKQDAVAVALQQCSQKGASDCGVSATYQNGCVALSWPEGKGATAYGFGDSAGEAERKSRGGCKADNGRCNVVYSACSKPIFHEY